MRKTRAIGLPGAGDWKSVQEVAALLSCHPQTVRRWIYAGQLREVWFGGMRRVNWGEVMALGREASPRKAPPKSKKTA